MKDKILEVLKSNLNEYVSGEDLSLQLNISRTAVWKHIKSLRDKGYVIESQPKLGHKLIKVADSLHPRELKPLLKSSSLGIEIKYLEQVGSTNDVAKELAEVYPEGTIILAEEQLGGKGRLGRNWVSPKGGGIWLSIILKPNINPAEAPKLTSVAALAVVKAIRENSGLNVEIKWPNDIVFKGRKVAGILTEMSAEIDKVNYIVLGIGINVNIAAEQFPIELAEKATSIMQELGQAVARNHLVVGILKNLDHEYHRFLQGEFGVLIEEVKKCSATLGKLVDVSNFKDSWEGIVEDIDSEGALLLRLQNGELKTIISGEVSVRGLSGIYAE